MFPRPGVRWGRIKALGFHSLESIFAHPSVGLRSFPGQRTKWGRLLSRSRTSQVPNRGSVMLGEDGVLYGLLRFNKAEYQRK